MKGDSMQHAAATNTKQAAGVLRKVPLRDNITQYTKYNSQSGSNFAETWRRFEAAEALWKAPGEPECPTAVAATTSACRLHSRQGPCYRYAELGWERRLALTWRFILTQTTRMINVRGETVEVRCGARQC